MRRMQIRGHMILGCPNEAERQSKNYGKERFPKQMLEPRLPVEVVKTSGRADFLRRQLEGGVR